MEKYLSAMDYGKKLILELTADGACGTAAEILRRWEKYFDGIIEVALYDPDLSQEEFAQLQAAARMSLDEYEVWRMGYGK